jgi:hypothetical protein
MKSEVTSLSETLAYANVIGARALEVDPCAPTSSDQALRVVYKRLLFAENIAVDLSKPK